MSKWFEQQWAVFALAWRKNSVVVMKEETGQLHVVYGLLIVDHRFTCLNGWGPFKNVNISCTPPVSQFRFNPRWGLLSVKDFSVWERREKSYVNLVVVFYLWNPFVKLMF